MSESAGYLDTQGIVAIRKALLYRAPIRRKPHRRVELQPAVPQFLPVAVAGNRETHELRHRGFLVLLELPPDDAVRVLVDADAIVLLQGGFRKGRSVGRSGGSCDDSGFDVEVQKTDMPVHAEELIEGFKAVTDSGGHALFMPPLEGSRPRCNNLPPETANGRAKGTALSEDLSGCHCGASRGTL